MTTRSEPEVPQKLSALIRLARKDLREVCADPLYKLNMSEWHYFDDDQNVCFVCLAGCVMAKSFDTDHEMTIDLDLFSLEWRRAFNALNNIRRGDIVEAVRVFHGDFIEDTHQTLLVIEKAIGIDARCRDPSKFSSDLYRIARDLEDLGY